MITAMMVALARVKHSFADNFCFKFHEFNKKKISDAPPSGEAIETLVISSRKEGKPQDQIRLTWPINVDGTMGTAQIKSVPMNFPETFTDRKGTCSFELKGEMFIIGGYSRHRLYTFPLFKSNSSRNTSTKKPHAKKRKLL